MEVAPDHSTRASVDGSIPSMDIMARAHRWDDREPGTYVRVLCGFPCSEVSDVGTTVHVMTDDDRGLADRLASDPVDYIWRGLEECAHGEVPEPEGLVQMVRSASQAGATPGGSGGRLGPSGRRDGDPLRTK